MSEPEWINKWVHTDTGEPCEWMTPELEAFVVAAYDAIERDEEQPPTNRAAEAARRAEQHADELSALREAMLESCGGSDLERATIDL